MFSAVKYRNKWFWGTFLEIQKCIQCWIGNVEIILKIAAAPPALNRVRQPAVNASRVGNL